MSDRLLIRGGYVLSMDRDVGELEPRRRADRGRADRRGRAGIDARRRRGDRRGGRRRHARLRRHASPHLADVAARDLRRLDADGLLPRHAADDLAALHGRGRLRGQLRGRARGARRRRDDDPRLLALQQHARARGRRDRRAARRGHPGASSRYGYFPAPASRPGFADHDERASRTRGASARAAGAATTGS